MKDRFGFPIFRYGSYLSNGVVSTVDWICNESYRVTANYIIVLLCLFFISSVNRPAKSELG